MSAGLLVGPSLCSDREPWEQQRGESRQAYTAWTAYRDMGEPRSYRRVARDLNRSATLIAEWGRKWFWQRRLEAYVRHLEEIRTAENIRAINEMNERHISTARLALEKVSEALNAVQGAELPVKAVPKLLSISVAVERMTLGLNPSSARSETRLNSRGPQFRRHPPGPNMVSEIIQKLSAVDRNLLHQLSLKHLQVITQEAELVEIESREARLTNSENGN